MPIRQPYAPQRLHAVTRHVRQDIPGGLQTGGRRLKSNTRMFA
jgi:hypothetical protein